MRKLKSVLVSSLYHIGFFDLVRFFQRKHVTILMYHRFSEQPEPFKLSQRSFEQQICFLKQKYNIIKFSDYVQVLYGERSGLPSNPLIITIDDGYQDNYEYAFPVLRKHSVPATIFLTTDFISHRAWLWSNKLEYILKKTNKTRFSFNIDGAEQIFNVDSFSGWHNAQLTIFNYCRSLDDDIRKKILNELADYLKVNVPREVTYEFAPLTWKQIREMESSCIEYGSHSCSHPIMSKLTDHELDMELRISKKIIEQKTNSPVKIFCYPNGTEEDFNDKVITAVRNIGYLAATTTLLGLNKLYTHSPFLLRRCALASTNVAWIDRSLTILS